jgi:hypothetical protein
MRVVQRMLERRPRPWRVTPSKRERGADSNAKVVGRFEIASGSNRVLCGCIVREGREQAEPQS